ncbi:uncharacterized protein cubi_02240 [Cryptosporidium ubiquitum]|uniref:Uncharacterized protein n=1 Tax=Cryptosporidium ubiquitum TaxID=857276 RepID=A0A1J4MFN1_9CRYT|nr:uncharacterized protein cubi_02240 [Cryptosporidium ubiquitum]OII73009.1 hypothetical protein cubi_02240 [Cryptosporidium ubiquitum]
MKFKLFTFFVLGLLNVFCGVSPPNVGALKIDTVFSEKNTVFGKNLKKAYKDVIASLVKSESHEVDQLYLELLSYNSTFHYMIILNNKETEGSLQYFSEKEKKLYFLCEDKIVDYIVKNKINKIEFLKKNCIEKSFENYLPQSTNRKLMQKNETESETEKELEKDELLLDIDKGNTNEESNNCEIGIKEPLETNSETTEKESSTCCCFKTKNKYNDLESAISDNSEKLSGEGNSTKFEGFDISETVESKDGTVSFEIEINDKNSIFDEILNAMKSENESILDYASIEERDLSSSELKEALEETEKEINQRKVEIRKLKETNDLRGLNSSSKTKSLRSNQGIPLLKIAESLTQRFFQTEQKELEKYFTPTKTKLLQLAIYEYLVIHSTLEDNLEKVVEIINNENGITRLRSFFGDHVNFTSIKYVFEQYFAIFDQVQKKRLYHKSDFIRFMLNLSTNKSNPMLNSPIFNLKLEIGSMIVFYSENDPRVQRIVIEEEINNTNKQLFYRDHSFFNFLLGKHFSIRENDEIFKKTHEIIAKNRNNNPLDRPKQCFLQTKQLLLEYNIFENIQNDEVLKIICLQTYGLVGLYSTIDQL